jgi:lysophospholipase L1-like esterase
MFRLGERHGVAVFDQYRSMGGSGSIHRWKSIGLAQTDLVHFTSEGYRVLARLLFDALLAGWGDSVSPSVPER